MPLDEQSLNLAELKTQLRVFSDETKKAIVLVNVRKKLHVTFDSG